jgi:hypothetical protein
MKNFVFAQELNLFKNQYFKKKFELNIITFLKKE